MYFLNISCIFFLFSNAERVSAFTDLRHDLIYRSLPEPIAKVSESNAKFRIFVV